MKALMELQEHSTWYYCFCFVFVLYATILVYSSLLNQLTIIFYPNYDKLPQFLDNLCFNHENFGVELLVAPGLVNVNI